MPATELRHVIHGEADARRAVLEAGRFSAEAGFAEVQSQMIATVVSELTRNILKYAGSGELTLRVRDGGGRRGIQVEARDQGPGIADCAAALQDHYSSGGTLGMGLPAVKRMMDDFDIDSAPGRGTRVTACKWQ